MEKPLTALARIPLLNAWGLFLLVSVPISLFMVYEMSQVDLSSGDGVSAMIGYSVRFSVPFIYLVVAASALHRLQPSVLSAWLRRNRKYLGLCFAVAMAWQGLFIFMMSLVYRDYYYDEVYLLRNELEGSVGYIFLTFMVLTSFTTFRRHLSAGQWRVLHLAGIYWLWGYAFAVYWWNLSYYSDPELIDHFYYWAGFIAFALRIAAWGKERRNRSVSETPIGLKWLGGLFVAVGLILSATGLQWQDAATTFLTSPAWSAELVLWLPFWPFEPFFPLMLIGFGALLFTQTITEAKPAHA